MLAVEFSHVSKRYGKNEKYALTDVSFGIEAGSFFGILSPHQAGKTTLLRLIFDYIRPDEGNIAVFERDSVKNSSKIRRYAGFVPARVNGDSRLRVRTILKQLHAPFGPLDEERLQELCVKFDLNPDAVFRSLTDCQRKCLMIVAVLLNDPPLIILDEPSLDLDLPMRVQTFSELHKLHQNGSTVIFSTISAEEITVHSTHTALLQDGTLLDTALTAEFSALHAHRVRLESPNTAEIIDALGFNSFDAHSHVVSFLYTEKIDTLIKTLASYEVTDLTIEQPTMDSILKAANLVKLERRSRSTGKDVPLTEIAQRGNLFEDDWETENASTPVMNVENEGEPMTGFLKPASEEPASEEPVENAETETTEASEGSPVVPAEEESVENTPIVSAEGESVQDESTEDEPTEDESAESASAEESSGKEEEADPAQAVPTADAEVFEAPSAPGAEAESKAEPDTAADASAGTEGFTASEAAVLPTVKAENAGKEN